MARRRTTLTWTKRRWRCRNPQCARKTFTEHLPAIPPHSRLTARLRETVGAAVGDGGRTVVQAARDFEVSWPVANAAFIAHAQTALPAATPPVEHLGIDETRRGKAKFRLVPDSAARMHADHLDPMVADLGFSVSARARLGRRCNRSGDRLKSVNPPVAGCWLALTGVYHLEPISHSVRLIVVRGAGASLPEPCALSATAADAYGVNLTKRTGGLYPGRASERQPAAVGPTAARGMNQLCHNQRTAPAGPEANAASRAPDLPRCDAGG